MTAIILSHPQMGENIGAAARAMHNFGLSDLRIVAPRDGWPNPKAHEMAAHADHIIEAATVYERLEDALADLQYVCASTARQRELSLPQLSAREAASQPVHGQVGIVFGRESSGLSNEEIALCDAVVSIPVHPDNPSLNIAQAVVVLAYEWFVSAGDTIAASSSGDAPPLADKATLYGLFDHLEAELDAANFWRVAEKKPAMWRNIRAMLQRNGLSEQEVRTWRGILRAIRNNQK